MSDSRLMQDTKTGKLVEFISTHDKEFAMVRDAGGAVTFLDSRSVGARTTKRKVDLPK